MATIDEMIRSYVASWNESDPAKRDRTIKQTWSPDGIYRNTTAEFAGYDGIAQAVTAAHDAFVANGFVFTLANVDTNHDAVRYRWEMLPAQWRRTRLDRDPCRRRRYRRPPRQRPPVHRQGPVRGLTGRRTLSI